MLPRLRTWVFVIHHLNPWGGHERSTLEIVRRLTRKFSRTSILAYSVEDTPTQKSFWGEYSLDQVRPNVKGPAILLMVYFMGVSFLKLFLRKGRLIHATGTCSLLSDVIQVQFLNASWKRKKREFQNRHLFENPMARQAGPVFSFILSLYHQSLLHFNVAVERWVYRKNKTYIVLSALLKREMELEFGIQEHVHVVHHGVDPYIFYPADVLSQEREALRKSHGVSRDEILILFVGEYERKGLCVVLHVLAKLSPGVRQKIKFWAVGGGSIDGFTRLAKELGIEQQTTFLGHQKNISDYYRAADLFLLPTYYEPFGLVVLEAMASGLPVIVTAEAGASELIEHGVSGLKILDPSNVGEILDLLQPLCEDPEQRAKMGKAARLVAEKRSWDQVAEEYEAILRPLLDPSSQEALK